MVVCFHYLEPLVSCRQQMLMVYQWMVSSVAFGDLVGGEDLTTIHYHLGLYSRTFLLRYIVGFGLVEMAISTNPKPTIYRNL